ncbi:diguanylate cyclase domain-containing protein [Psychromonas ossibalaenae]|uniref:diguanylate cyclase domain-containing protein n=1 Tax=Psychromonas ossibalaenae TaxID=444922 RepID=UPI00037A0D8D|nr:diguanylate cyclase [Psychromonas ossibalaenae]
MSNECVGDSDSALYENLFNNSHSVMLIIHPNSGAILDANIKACQYYGYSYDKITTMNITDINTLPEHSVINKMQKVQRNQQVHFNFKHKLSNGEIRDVEVYSNPITIKRETALHSIIYDVTDRNEKEKQKEHIKNEMACYARRLSKSHDTLSKVLNSLDSIVYVSDFYNYDMIFMNDYTKNLFAEINFSEKKCWQVLQEGQSGPCAFCSNHHLIKNNKPTGVYVWEFQNTKNKRWYQCRDQAVYWVDNRLVRIEIAVDITDRKQAEEKILYTATHDNLSKLPNRYLFMDRLSVALAASQRNNSLIGILFVDLDEFKAVNDSYGHQSGDLVLQLVSKRLLCCARKTDTVARFGGDEFAIVLSPINKKQDAELVAQKVLKIMASPFTLDKKQINIGVSIGIAVSSQNNSALDSLLKQADSAMYNVKKNGKSNYCFFEENNKR